MSKNCADCGVAIADGSTRCRSCAAKSRWLDESYRMKAVGGMSIAAKRRWADDEKRAYALSRIHSDSAQLSRSEKAKIQWMDPEFRAIVSEAAAAQIEMQSSTSSLELKVLAYFEDMLDVRMVRQYRPLGYNRVYDIYVPDYNLLVEVDGWYWHKSDTALAKGVDDVDADKDRWAVLNGYNLLRLDEDWIEDSNMYPLCEMLTTVI